MHINDIIIEGLLDTDGDVSIITLENWQSDWPLKDVHFLDIGTLSQVKQSTSWVEIIEPEGQTQRLLQYLSNITVNLLGHDLL